MSHRQGSVPKRASHPQVSSKGFQQGTGGIKFPLGTATMTMVWHRGHDRLLRFMRTNTKRPVRSHVAIQVFKGVGSIEGRSGQMRGLVWARLGGCSDRSLDWLDVAGERV